ncbi:hypothetical protein H5410_030019 [Solanum commersonii]|uniref:Uncharacterized protein n=1 Tax=Solanum commersonii TaxID=4109 RepID=A0A9J5YEF7_SOLCO|nr:hypothetical protein H5410_030019 [Solanum commersonii]
MFLSVNAATSIGVVTTIAAPVSIKVTFEDNGGYSHKPEEFSSVEDIVNRVKDRFYRNRYRNRSSLPDFITGIGSYRNRFYRKLPMVPSGPLVTGLEPVWTGSEPVLTGSFMYR